MKIEVFDKKEKRFKTIDLNGIDCTFVKITINNKDINNFILEDHFSGKISNIQLEGGNISISSNKIFSKKNEEMIYGSGNHYTKNNEVIIKGSNNGIINGSNNGIINGNNDGIINTSSDSEIYNCRKNHKNMYKNVIDNSNQNITVKGDCIYGGCGKVTNITSRKRTTSDHIIESTIMEGGNMIDIKLNKTKNIATVDYLGGGKIIDVTIEGCSTIKEVLAKFRNGDY